MCLRVYTGMNITHFRIHRYYEYQDYARIRLYCFESPHVQHMHACMPPYTMQNLAQCVLKLTLTTEHAASTDD